MKNLTTILNLSIENTAFVLCTSIIVVLFIYGIYSVIIEKIRLHKLPSKFLLKDKTIKEILDLISDFKKLSFLDKKEVNKSFKGDFLKEVHETLTYLTMVDNKMCDATDDVCWSYFNPKTIEKVSTSPIQQYTHKQMIEEVKSVLKCELKEKIGMPIKKKILVKNTTKKPTVKKKPAKTTKKKKQVKPKPKS